MRLLCDNAREEMLKDREKACKARSIAECFAFFSSFFLAFRKCDIGAGNES